MRQLTIVSKLTNRDNESLKQYFRDISAYPKFTPEEEAECAFRATNGDSKALNELVNRNLRFVVSVAKQYENKDVQLGDLINEGNLGLISAASRFKPDMGFKFISFSVWWIRKYITEYLTNNSRSVRIPSNRINHLAKLNKKISTLEQKIGRTVELEDIISEYGNDISDDELKSINILNCISVDSLDRDVSTDGDGVSLSDIISDDSYYTPADQLVRNSDIKIQIERILNTLTPKEKAIIVSLFGLNGEKQQTLSEVGLKFGKTNEAIRLTKIKILNKLKLTSDKHNYLSTIN